MTRTIFAALLVLVPVAVSASDEDLTSREPRVVINICSGMGGVQSTHVVGRGNDREDLAVICRDGSRYQLAAR